MTRAIQHAAADKARIFFCVAPDFTAAQVNSCARSMAQELAAEFGIALPVARFRMLRAMEEHAANKGIKVAA